MSLGSQSERFLNHQQAPPNAYIFHGIVYPERADVHFNLPNAIRLESSKGKFGDATLRINYSQIVVEVQDPDRSVPLDTYKNSIQSFVSGCVDSLGFSNGCGYEVEIRSCLDLSSSEYKVFGVGIIALENRYKDFLAVTEQIFEITMGPHGYFIRRALADLRLSIREPTDTPFYCFRAIESLRHFYAKTCGLDKEKPWAEFREDCAIAESDTRAFEAHAKALRHGDLTEFDLIDRNEIMLISWTIFDKVLAWSRGNRTLAKS